MASKERKGGLLHNEDVEKELARNGTNEQTTRNYRGSQDTGDEVVREKGTSVQQEDGTGADEKEEQ